ncbi:MAG TPA: hypothetical protein VK666_17765 [Chryseolinea sp.]|nr:hypothetical protein [Chryseolinea sp.]
MNIGVWATSYASMGKYYAAESVIPDLANPDDRLLLYSNILYREVLRIAPNENNPWHEYDEDSKRLISFVIYGQELI